MGQSVARRCYSVVARLLIVGLVAGAMSSGFAGVAAAQTVSDTTPASTDTVTASASPSPSPSPEASPTPDPSPSVDPVASPSPSPSPSPSSTPVPSTSLNVRMVAGLTAAQQ